MRQRVDELDLGLGGHRILVLQPVSRTDLTEQYELAVRRHGLGYRALKRIALDSLRHAFLPDGERATLMRRLATELHRFEARFP